MPRQKKLPPGMEKRGKVYYCNFRIKGQKIRRRLSGDLDTAKEMLNELRSRCDREDLDLINNDCRWADLRKEFLTWAKQQLRTWECYLHDLDLFESYCQVQSVRQVTPELIFGYRQWRLAQTYGKNVKRPITPRTVNLEVGTVRNMLNKGVEWKRIGRNPIRDVRPLRHDEPTKCRRAMTAAEVQALFDNSPPHLCDAWTTFASTGMRHDELATLEFSDVDLERRVLMIRPKHAKSGHSREVPLSDQVVEIISRLKAEAPNRRPVRGKTKQGRLSRTHVFVNGANTPWRNHLLRAFYACCARAGIEGAEPNGSVDIHAIRGTFVSLSFEGGADPKAVQETVGHSTLQLTMNVYAKTTDRAKRKAIDALPFATVSEPDHIISLDDAREKAGTNGRKSHPIKIASS